MSEEIVSLYRAGIPVKQIMRKFGLKSNSVVYRHVQPNRYPARLSISDRSRIKALYLRGEKIDYIAYALRPTEPLAKTAREQKHMKLEEPIPKAHSIRIMYCDACEHPHLVFLDKHGDPIAHAAVDVELIHLLQSALYRISTGEIPPRPDPSLPFRKG